MKYFLIDKFSDFVLNETLKTHDIDITINNIHLKLNLLRYNFSISKNNNTIELTLNGFRYNQSPSLVLDVVMSLFIDSHGWFPSKMKLINVSGKNNILSYDENYLIKNVQFLETISIIFEAKYDLIKINPDIVYHLSIQEFENSILNKGLIPKSKSKISKHLDRIYLCEDVNDCYNLIPGMKADYLYKKTKENKINIKWIIYEIDLKNFNIKLYNDPNYLNKGYYCINNIPKERIKIFDKE